ncbi:MAG: hypothetical protein KFF68_13370 [Desulfosarcina sp.]|nr:hypothetical protein [Desulfosarcina sp.]
MTEKKEKGLLQKLFGANSSCCKIQLEEVDESPSSKDGEKQDRAQAGCCSADKRVPKR